MHGGTTIKIHITVFIIKHKLFGYFLCKWQLCSYCIKNKKENSCFLLSSAVVRLVLAADNIVLCDTAEVHSLVSSVQTTLPTAVSLLHTHHLFMYSSV
jgi:hypothetical protein